MAPTWAGRSLFSILVLDVDIILHQFSLHFIQGRIMVLGIKYQVIHLIRLTNGVLLETIALVVIGVDVGAATIFSVSESEPSRSYGLDSTDLGRPRLIV